MGLVLGWKVETGELSQCELDRFKSEHKVVCDHGGFFRFAPY